MGNGKANVRLLTTRTPFAAAATQTQTQTQTQTEQIDYGRFGNNKSPNRPFGVFDYGSAKEMTDKYGIDVNRKWEAPMAFSPHNLNLDNVKYTFSPEAQQEIVSFIRQFTTNNSKPLPKVDEVYVPVDAFPRAKLELEFVEKRNMIDGEGIALIQPITGLDSVFEICLSSFIQTCLLGKPLEQNANGDRVIHVYDRDSGKRMSDGQRYHQSREGGSIHTDNVNIPEVWEYMFLTCVQPAFLGGESIMGSCKTVHNIMLEKCPEVLEVLRQDFWWEYRGFSDEFYRAPILFYNEKGEPMIRYLRDYLESAYVRKNIKLTNEQLHALDVLDCLAQSIEVQVRYNLAKGEALLANDTHMLHGRTCFIDKDESTLIYDAKKGVNRLYQRTWLKK